MSRHFIRLLPLLLTFPASLPAQQKEGIELPANLSPALRARLLAQNNVPQEEAAAEVAPDAPAEATPADVPAEPPVIPAATAADLTGQPTEAAPAPAVPAQIQPPGRPVQRPGRAVVPPGGGTLPGGAGFPRPGGIPLPGARNTPGAVANPAGLTATSNSADFLLAFTGNPIEEVLGEYERISGHHVIRPANLSGNVVVVQNPNRPMTVAEGMDFIKASLMMQGFMITEYMPGIDKILVLDAPPLLNPPIDGAPLYTNVDDLPDTDEVVNFVIRLDYLTAADASQVFAAAVPTHTWSKYVAVPSANAILVQENSSNIRTLMKIKEKVDLEPVLQVHEFVELERASAEDVQQIIEQILQAQTQARSGNSSGGRGSVNPLLAAANLNAANNGQGGGNEAAASMIPDSSSVIVKADPRTNRLFINGPKVNVGYMKALAKEFDQPSRVKNLLTQQLRYIPVDDFLEIASSSLEARGAGSQTQGGGAAAGGAGGGLASSTGGRRSTGGDTGGFGGAAFGGNSGRNSSTGTGGRSTGTGSRTSTGGGGGLANSQSANALPRSVVVGKTLLISDPRMNSLIVSGPPESIERVSELIREMDKRPLQVHINAVIAQISLGDDLTTGMDLLRRVEDVQVAGQDISIAGLYKSSGSGSFIDPGTLTSIAGFPTGLSGLNAYATVGELFNATISAMENTRRFKVLAKPHIATANNEVANISIGQRVPVPANQQSSVVAGGTTSVTSNIEYENVVLSLDVRALINSKNEITLEVSQINDNVQGSTSINGNDIPNIATQELNTKITIPNGAILTIGGLVQESKTQNVNGLPFLSKIPVLKHLFGSTTNNGARSELLVMLQPRIIDTADDMIEVHTSEVQRTVIGPEAEEFANPDRKTGDLMLPTYEKDIPFDSAGYPSGHTSPKRSFWRRVGDVFRRE